MITPSVDVITFGGKDIAFSSYGPIWKMHRRIASKALRHYMQGDALESRIHDAVKTAFDEIDKVPGEFDPSSYISFIIGNILTCLCFGGKYAFKNSEVSQVLHKRDVFIEQFGIGAWEDFVPGLRHVYKTDVFKRLEIFTQDMMEDFMRRKLKLAETTFSKDNVRHFADTLLLARLEATEEEGEEVMEALSEDRLVQTLADIFFGPFGSWSTFRLTMIEFRLHTSLPLMIGNVRGVAYFTTSGGQTQSNKFFYCFVWMNSTLQKRIFL
ncbi:cytochrome P450 1A1-like [Mercenaria mercenaria]|uniref:cytochrome P450 1A1-like n=1 Tax=Mercenaria mercenaria TaxID=6596 RepID=UPI00234F3EC7|nr:cytochrome P450 1A1-like [Mercenaria mercenaria]